MFTAPGTLRQPLAVDVHRHDDGSGVRGIRLHQGGPYLHRPAQTGSQAAPSSSTSAENQVSGSVGAIHTRQRTCSSGDTLAWAIRNRQLLIALEINDILPVRPYQSHTD